MDTFVVDNTIKATVVLLTSFALRLALRRSSAAVRHLLWTVTVICLLLLPLFSLMPWRVELPARVAAIQAPAAAAAPQTVVEVRPWLPAPAPSRRPSWLVLIWGAGLAAVAARLVAGGARVWWVARHARPAVYPLLGQLRAQLGMERAVSLVESERAVPPMTWGVLRPVILLPAAARQWPVERLRLVLLHELVHIRRADFLTLLLAQAARALFWFHPLVWLAAAELRKDGERACDDAILALGTRGSDYAEHLLELARSLKWSLAVGMAEPSQLESRLRAMLNPRLNRRALRRRYAVSAAVLAVCLIAPLAATHAQQASAGTISGVITDISGARVPFAAISLSGQNTKLQEVASASAAGEYAFIAIPAGHYQLEVRQPGFMLYQRKDIVLEANASLRVDVTLQLGRVSETVDVVAKRTKPPQPARVGPPQRIRVGGNVQASRLLYQPKPEYPAHAVDQGIEGTVLLHAVIGIDGSLLSLEPLNTRVDPELTQAALDSVRQWRYKPTLLNGQPVEVVTSITVNFRLSPQ